MEQMEINLMVKKLSYTKFDIRYNDYLHFFTTLLVVDILRRIFVRVQFSFMNFSLYIIITYIFMFLLFLPSTIDPIGSNIDHIGEKIVLEN